MRMHVLLAGAIAAMLTSSSGNGLADNIVTICGQASGTFVTLDSYPVITAILSRPGTFGGHTYQKWSFLAQDSTGSIDLSGLLSGLNYVPTVGDIITVSGTFSWYHQIPEISPITSISLVSSGNPVPAPLICSILELNVSTLPIGIAGHLIRLDNVTILGTSGIFPMINTSYTITDHHDDRMVLYYWPTSYSACGVMSGTPIPTGLVNIIGFDSVYPSGNGNDLIAEFIPIQINFVSPSSPVLSLPTRKSGSQFGFLLSGVSGQTYTVLASTNVSLPLSSWSPILTTNLSSSSAIIQDDQATNQWRFYRAKVGQ
jgi:hypothetical protein